ncbi:hypothetical protein OF001_U10017 [Pseudomonas sp. OF001]|nr:hypothetical protein OF001_U10017 [Pseudomonas sp. OF001]
MCGWVCAINPLKRQSGCVHSDMRRAS